LLVGPRDQLRTFPAATRAALARINLGLDGVTEMDWLGNVKKKMPSEAAHMKAKHLPDTFVEEALELTAWAMRDLNPRPRACEARALTS
jgi:hypothetical protein